MWKISLHVISKRDSSKQFQHRLVGCWSVACERDNFHRQIRLLSREAIYQEIPRWYFPVGIHGNCHEYLGFSSFWKRVIVNICNKVDKTTVFLGFAIPLNMLMYTHLIQQPAKTFACKAVDVSLVNPG